MRPSLKPHWRRAVARLVLTLPLSIPLFGASSAHAFSGEDPVFGHPWYHEKITREATKAMGFKYNPQKDAPDLPKANIAEEILNLLSDDPRRGGDDAAEAVAWHADYIDSYLYNPMWWAKDWSNTGIHRYKAAQAIEGDLKLCHFDDLFSTKDVNAMWRRYASGAFAGLIWASEQPNGGDVHAAQNILGISLHAMQDFYAHSSWVDKPERRERTFFQYALADRLADNIYTGAYEKDHQLGIKSHGKWIPQNSIWGQPGVKQVMEIACDPISPFSSSDACVAWKEVKAGTPMKPTVGGITLPSSIMVYTPAGIALDNTWVADEAVNQRGIGASLPPEADKSSGKRAFDYSYNLALQQSIQWLQTLEKAMADAGKAKFWNDIKSTPASDKERTNQYENYGQFPFMFLSAGKYPPEQTSDAEQWFLRLKIKTASGRTGGTNSDIKVRANGVTFPLDYSPTTTPLLAYNDFETDDNDAYYVGPFDKCPDSIELVNDAADGKEIVKALGRDFVRGLEFAGTTVVGLLSKIVAGQPDKIAVNKELWMPENLAELPTSQMVAPKPIGGIKFPPVPTGGKPFQIRLDGDKEGDYEVRGTIHKMGEDEFNYQLLVTIDNIYCYEESKMDRFSIDDEVFLLCALNPFPGEQQSWLSPIYENFDSKETHGVGYAFKTVSVPKSSGMLSLAITIMEHDSELESTRKDLLAKFAGTYDEKTKDAKRSFIDAVSTSIASDWKVQHLEVTAFNRNGLIHVGTVFDEEVNRWVKPKKDETFRLNPAAAISRNVTTAQLLPFLGKEGNQSPEPEKPAPTQPTTPTTPTPTVPTTPTTPTNPNVPVPTTPTIPTGPAIPTVPTTPTIPTTPTTPTTPTSPGVPTSPATGTGGTVRSLGSWGVKIESARLARDNQIEVVATYKNVTRSRISFEAGSLSMVITDADGVGFHNYGNLYRAGGDPDMEPEQMPTGTLIEPGAQVKVLALFDVVPGTSALKTLTVFGHQVKPLTFNISNLQLPQPTTGVSFPVKNAVGATNTFTDFKEFGVRLDGVRRGRGDMLQVFVTIKNRHPDPNMYATHPRWGLEVTVFDADGMGHDHNNTLYHASGESLDLAEIADNITMLPDGETTVCYQVAMPKGAVAKQLRISYYGDKFTVNLPAIP